MNWIEIVATIFGILCVWLTIRQNIWCWSTGLVQVGLYIYIFFDAKLYSDFILHIIYVVLGLYGWYHWLHGGKNKKELPVSLLPRKALIIWIILAGIGTMCWGFLMGTLTDASVPYADAFTTVTSLIAQWLLAKKRLESWVFWIAVDIIAIGVYFYKQLYFTTGLYSVFLVLAVLGYIEWKKSYGSDNRVDSGKICSIT